jgi:hypothetical protein
MLHDEIIDYIVHELAHGTSDAEIKNSLKGVGWHDADIEENLRAAHQRMVAAPIVDTKETKEKRAFLKRNSKAIVALSIAALLLAGGAFAAYKFIIPPPPEKMFEIARQNMQDVKSFDFSGRITADVTDPGSILNLQALLPKELANTFIDPRVAGAATDMQLAIDFTGSIDGSDGNNPKADMSMDISSGIISIGMKAKVLGEIMYVRFDKIPKISEEVDKFANVWIKIDPEALTKEYGLGIDLEQAKPNYTESQKQQIEEISKNAHWFNAITKLPNDSIDGISMYHYSVVVDKAGTKEYLKQIDQVNKAAGGNPNVGIELLDSMQLKDVEVWIGKTDKLVHRVSMNVAQAASNDSIPEGSMNLLMNFSNYNNVAVIEAPASSKDIQEVIEEVMGDAQIKSRDAMRVSNAYQIMTALELYYNDYGRYPGSLSSTKAYLPVVPTAPTPPDGTCTEENNKYVYKSLNGGKSYSLNFCLGVGASGYGVGVRTASPQGIQ